MDASACKRTLKLNDKSLVRWQKQTVAKQFVVKCKLKANDEEADDGDGDADADADASDDVSSEGEPETESGSGEGGDEKIKVRKRPRERVDRPLRANGVELSQMYEVHLSVLGTN